MTFDERLENYITQFTLRKNRGKDGLTGKQHRRLLKKNRTSFARRQEGETT
jgi:hypothetical protein